MKAYPQWRSLREIDLAARQSKGASFRLFKRMNSQCQEGRDFVVLHHEHDAGAIAALRESARIYASSVNVVLRHTGHAQTLLAALAVRSATSRARQVCIRSGRHRWLPSHQNNI